MEIRPVHSLEELEEKIQQQRRSFLLLYKENSTQSGPVLKNCSEAASVVSDIGIFSADVSRVRDIHTAYSITSVPTLLEFQEKQLKNIYKGTHDTGYYRGLFENAVYRARSEKAGKPAKQVRVYTTPTCSWCNALKSYLRKNHVPFTEIDVSADENAAREMVNKSGQQGVPQTSVNGNMVVGFDRTKLNRLLEIKG